MREFGFLDAVNRGAGGDIFFVMSRRPRSGGLTTWRCGDIVEVLVIELIWI